MIVLGGAVAVIALVTAVALLWLRRNRPRPVVGPVPREPLAAVRRDDLLAKIDETFRAGRSCVLLGRGGAGKTHAAAAFVREARSPVLWVAAADPANTARAYAELARQQGLAGPEAGLAWLDGRDGAIVVFDGPTDPDALTRWLPARARVLVTTTVPDFEILGATVAVTGFDPATAAAFVQTRSGRDADAAAVARELGYLPLALAQAAGVIRVSGSTEYLDRLPGTPLLEREPGEDHSPWVEDTTLAALRTAGARDGRALVVAELLAVLAPRGVRRALVHRAGPDPVAVDAALSGLEGASLAEFDVSGEVVTMHRLTRRAVLGRLHAEDRLAEVLDRAFAVLDGEETADLADHAAALWRHFRALPSVSAGPRLGPILRLRRRSVELLVAESAFAQARGLGREVLADHEAYLPAGHEDTALAAESLDRAAHPPAPAQRRRVRR
ncbi:hypothetical protein SAMN05421837_1011292 [Amycolatopsis pretoriensis]|uniref:Uncharacterized protein n=2 Tax=Amycolatopsis pretoriensis TaxID=218821 RepID=A0A1H5Q800_9PSEU|nr:hypothetical protein SAMN05421837_1011292 [Amycolatopsis pretoriensis]